MNKRKDNRNTNEFQPIFMKTGVICHATGSAYIEIGKTKIICGIYGPRQTKTSIFSEIGKLQCELKFTNFARKNQNEKDKKYSLNKEEKEYSILMNQSLEVSVMLDKFPKSVVDVYALVIEDGGGSLSAAITCASLALADAGIEMYDLVPSCQVAILNNSLLLDPTEEEENNSTGRVVIAYMPSLNEVTQLFQFGEIEYSKVQESIELNLDGCAKIHAIMRSALIKKKKK